jgi:trypsin
MSALRLLATLLLAVSMAVSPVFAVNAKIRVAIEQHQSMHEIVMTFTDADGKHGALCTAYAVGPHTLMTAEHCDVKSDSVFVDPISLHEIRENKISPIKIVDREFDGQDHMLLDLDGINFAHTVEVRGYSANGPRLPIQGEHIHWWGNPGGMRDQYREGIVTGVIPWNANDDSPEGQHIEGPSLFLVQAAVIGGDSGSAVFGDDGRVVGIVTFGIDDGQIMGMFPVQFTPSQIANSLA